MAADAAVIWHEAECGGYAADLPLWERLAARADGPVLELGCGTGRVSLHLARRGHPTVGIDSNDPFVAAMNRRAGGLPAEARVADARDFRLERSFRLVLAPMQLVQLFASRAERLRCLRCVEAHLDPGGIAAFSLVEELAPGPDTSPPLPDTREVGDRVYSSLPIETAIDDGAIVIRRLRQVLSPGSPLSEELDEVRLQSLSTEALEADAQAAGLRSAGRRRIPPTSEHVGSMVVLLEKVR